MPLLTIARLTLHEAARRRLLLAVAILTVLVIVFTGWGFSRLSTLTGENGQPLSHGERVLSESTLVILIAYMFSVVLAVGSAFLAAPAIAADVESGLVLALLPRPIRRSDLVLGKWLGFAVLVAGYAAIAGGLELAVIRAVTGYAPPHPVLAVAYLIGQSLVLLTLALLASTRLAPITGGIIAVVLFGVAWIAGIVEVVGSVFSNATIAAVGTAFGLLVPTDSLWRGAVYNLEPAAMVAASHGIAREAPFSVNSPPPASVTIWAAGWIVVMLGMAVLSFDRRDL